MKPIYNTLFAALCCMVALNAQAQERTFHRNKVLIEKHTGTGCPACPSADNVIEKYIADTNNEDNVAILRHHSFSGGLLNTSVSVALAGTWHVGAWPSVLVDRYGFFGAKTECASYSTTNAYDIRSLRTIEKRLEAPTCVSLSFEGSSYDPATGKLRLVLSGEVTEKLPYPRIHAFITQSGIVASQSGATGPYVHDDAVRDCLMDNVDGDVLTVNPDGTYSVTFERVLLSKYGNVTSKTENMKIVAFVSSYVDDSGSYYTRDYSTSEVHNADVVELLDLPATSPCAAPSIDYKNGAFVGTSATPNSVCHYEVKPLMQSTAEREGIIDLDAPAFTVTAYAEAAGFAPSVKIARTFSLRDILGSDSGDVRDIDGNGLVNKADIDALANKLLKK